MAELARIEQDRNVECRFSHDKSPFGISVGSMIERSVE